MRTIKVYKWKEDDSSNYFIATADENGLNYAEAHFYGKVITTRDEDDWWRDHPLRLYHAWLDWIEAWDWGFEDEATEIFLDWATDPQDRDLIVVLDLGGPKVREVKRDAEAGR